MKAKMEAVEMFLDRLITYIGITVVITQLTLGILIICWEWVIEKFGSQEAAP